MKNNLFCVILAVLLCINFSGCAISTYACDIIDTASPENNFYNDNGKLNSITINGNIYTVNYVKSTISELTNNQIDRYSVIEGAGSELIYNPTIDLNGDNGNLMFFAGITPYPAIENIKNLSDTEIEKAVKKLLSDTIAFSKYNDFSLLHSDLTGEYTLTWQVKHETVCNINIKIVINSQGYIYLFNKIDSCREDFKETFLNNTKRDEILNSKLHEKLKIESKDNIKFYIESELLSLYKGEDAVIYTVKVTDDEGFSQLFVLVISKNS